MHQELCVSEELFNLLEKNVTLVTFYYKLAAFIFFTVMLLHIAFSGWLVMEKPSADLSQVSQFTAFNAAVLVVEVLLGRIAFMLGSRSGQLMDLKLMILLAGPKAKSDELHRLALTIMSLRRESSGMKLVDLEELLQNIKKP